MPRDTSRGRSRDERDERDERDDAPRGRGRGNDRDDPPPRRGRDDRDDRGSSRSSGGYQYRGRTSEDASRRAKQSDGRYDSLTEGDELNYKSADGENCIRIIPWASGDKKFDKLVEKWGNHWGIDLIVHNNVGADKSTYLCLDKMFGKSCPMCDAYRTEDIEDLKPKSRVLCWLIDRNDEKAGPKLWSMPLANSKDISGESVVRGSGELLPIDDPEEGYDILFMKEGSKRNTRYKQFRADRAPSPLSKNERKMDEWLAYVEERPLPEILKEYDAEYLDKVLSGQSSQRDEDDDEGQERGSRRSSRGDDRDRDRGERENPGRPSRRASRDDPSDDDDRGRDRDDPPPRGRRGGDDEEFSRPSRRPSRDDREARDDPPEEPEERGSRRSGRASREPENDPPRTERYRGRSREDEEPPEDAEPEETNDRGSDTKERLAGVGRRSRR